MAGYVDMEGRVRSHFSTNNRRVRVLLPDPELPAPLPEPLPVSAPSSAYKSAEQIFEMVERHPASGLKVQDSTGMRSRRRSCLRVALDWLAEAPGDSWQERWSASGIEQRSDWPQMMSNAYNEANQVKFQQGHSTTGVIWLIALDVVRPSYEWLHTNHLLLRTLYSVMFTVRDPNGHAALVDAVRRNTDNDTLFNRYSSQASYLLSKALAHTGKTRLADLSVNDITEARESARGLLDRMPSGAAYNAMSWAGLLPADAPETFLNTLRGGQRTVDELVTNSGIKSRAIKQLFIDYFRVRSIGLDYVSLSSLVTTLVKNFWVEIETLSPGIETLNLAPQLVDAWKERVRIIRHGTKAGRPRKDHGALLLAVRAFYYDLNDWAQADPERYGAFGGPNPIGRDDTVAFAKEKRRQRSASHERTRQRQPLLPALLNWVDGERKWHEAALEQARTTKPGERFIIDGVTCEVLASRAAGFGGVHQSVKRSGSGITVQRFDTGKRFDAVNAEATFFWRWATINLLKETGTRIEELEELTHASITQYRLPTTGEVLPLLQIAPSKTDRERVLLMSPELTVVLAAVVSRVRSSSPYGKIPLIRRYDYHEKLESDPMPFLFQRVIDGENRPINRAWILNQLRKSVKEAGIVGEDGEPIYFQNHDMRRIFATEAVLAGLPVHILAQVMGHDSLESTQQYMAIYPEQVFRSHRAFIERRRALRPSSEYRQPTDAEFEDFLGHFERRKLELGTCGRAYGTPCIHEHACVRCSMLQLDPEQVGRLEEIADSLRRRIQEAESQGWLGEVEGLQVSLAAAEQKLATAGGRPPGPVSLGLPTLRETGTEHRQRR